MPVRFYLDAPSLVYRAYFALPKTLTSTHGRPVNAVRGFMEMVTRLLVDRRPDGMIAVFDADWRPRFRVDAYAGYKVERPDEPEDLTVQFEILAEVLDAAGLVRAESEGLEADDAIGSLIQSKPPGEDAVVVTGDRDLVCLVRDPDVRLLVPVRGVSEMDELDEAAVEAKYGIPPALYPEFATLRGDPSDGLPGVAGVGPVRAARLLRDHGSIENLLDSLEGLPPKLRDALVESRDYLDAMKTVVPLVYDAEVTMTEGGTPDDEWLEVLAKEHNLGSSATRLAQALRGER